MSPTPLDKDTLGDKLLRFVIGAAAGMALSWTANISRTGDYLENLMFWAVVCGALCTLLGYRVFRIFRHGAD